MNRLFLAAELPDHIKSTIISRKDSIAGRNNYKWEPLFKLHLTLQFIGDCNEELTQNIVSALSSLNNQKKVNTTLTSFGTFTKSARPTIFFAGLEPTPELQHLSQFAGGILKSLAVRLDEKPFHPHITLLRVKEWYETGNIDNLLVSPPFNLPFAIEEVTLYKSVLLPTGSKYNKVAVFHLL